MAHGNLNYDQIRAACRQGDGSKMQMAGAGTKTAGHVLIYDAHGNAIDGGAAGGSLLLETNGTANGDQTVLNLVAGSNVTLSDNGFGAVTIAASGGGSEAIYYHDFQAPPKTGWSWVNQGTASVDTSQPYLHFKIPTDGPASAFYERVLSASPYYLRAAVKMNSGTNGSPGMAFGIAIRNSVNDKRYIYFWYNGLVYLQRYTGGTYTAQQFSNGIGPSNPDFLWLTIWETGGTLFFGHGKSRAFARESVFYSEPSGTWVSPDRGGVMLGKGSVSCWGDLVSWDEAATP